MMPRRRWLRRVRCAPVAGWQPALAASNRSGLRHEYQLAAMNEALGITTRLLLAEPSALTSTEISADPSLEMLPVYYAALRV
jgi:hypothetical protein